MKSLYMLAAPPLDSIRTEEQHTTEKFGEIKLFLLATFFHVALNLLDPGLFQLM